MNTATTSPVLAKEPFLRAAGVCGPLALVTVSVGYIGGALAQPDAYSSADDATSDLGALTANKAWIQNQIGSNLTGILTILLGLGLWRALSPDVLGRIGAGAVMLTGLATFLDGFFRLDCRGIDPGCTNDSWHSSAHKDEQSLSVRDIRSGAHPGVRVPPDSRVARRVAAVAAGPARGDRVRRALLCPRRWCVSARRELDVVRVACLPRCALDPNGKCTSSADRVTESVSIPAFSGRRRLQLRESRCRSGTVVASPRRSSAASTATWRFVSRRRVILFNDALLSGASATPLAATPARSCPFSPVPPSGLTGSGHGRREGRLWQLWTLPFAPSGATAPNPSGSCRCVSSCHYGHAPGHAGEPRRSDLRKECSVQGVNGDLRRERPAPQLDLTRLRQTAAVTRPHSTGLDSHSWVRSHRARTAVAGGGNRS
jgi:hypothetical protein